MVQKETYLKFVFSIKELKNIIDIERKRQDFKLVSEHEKVTTRRENIEAYKQW